MKKYFSMKNFLLLVAIIVLAIGMTGCGKSSDSGGSRSAKKKSSKAEFNIGETWEVPGEWRMKITGVSATDERNQFSDKTPGAVYIVDYTYENLGYEDSHGIMDGLYISVESNIVDAKGKMGYGYPGSVTTYPQEVPVGATCDAQGCIGVENSGDFKITVRQYDSKDNKHSATFIVKVK